MQRAINHFRDVMRRDIGGHTNGNTGRTVDQQIRNTGRQYRRLSFLTVVVRNEVNRVFFDISQQFAGDLIKPALGVAHRCGIVAINRSEVALAIDQCVTQGKILRHTHQRVVNRLVAVGVILTHHFADHTGALHIRPVPDVIGFMHREQYASMHRLQAIPNIWERAANDHAHGVIEIALAHLFFK